MFVAFPPLLLALCLIGATGKSAFSASSESPGCAPPAAPEIVTPEAFRPPAQSARLTGDGAIVWSKAPALDHPSIQYQLLAGKVGALYAEIGEPIRGSSVRIPLTVISDTRATEPKSVPPSLRLRIPDEDGEARLSASAQRLLKTNIQDQWLLVAVAPNGNLLASSGLQMGQLLDTLYGEAARAANLGWNPKEGVWRVWAPTAQAVRLCLRQPSASATGQALEIPAHRDDDSGVWSVKVPQHKHPWLAKVSIQVYHPGHGVVQDQVTDPYSVALNANSREFSLLDLNDRSTFPVGWTESARRKRPLSNHQLAIYELHVRDFSIADSSVPQVDRGRYSAFNHPTSRGMQHLKRLAQAGITDVHLLPVFDFSTVDEQACARSGHLLSHPHDPAEQALDCYNWGYDPLHFNAPEGSYSRKPEDPAHRIKEFRQMVLGLRRLGLRVGMDVVYNHTSASGLSPNSVLDRVVPGYYHRLSEQGAIERSTCCENTATERIMMAKLLQDSLLIWARDYGIDSFRFDLMGHQPRQVMVQAQAYLQTKLGRTVNFLGEGWNFGEVANGKLFAQASQLSLYGTGIATFSDRGRDAIRGGSAGDRGKALQTRPGLVNGLFARDASATVDQRQQLLDLAKSGLVGALRDYALQTDAGRTEALENIDYAGQPAGYAAQTGEAVTYVENHDNHTLYDLNVLRAPPTWASERLAQAQLLGLAYTAFSQGIAYFHAGVDTLRSKSLDRNSFDSGDRLNSIDWTLSHNGFGLDRPLRSSHEIEWPLMQEAWARTHQTPSAEQIRWVHRAFLDLLSIRHQNPLFALNCLARVQSQARFLPVDSQANPGLIVLRLDHSPPTPPRKGGQAIKGLLVVLNFSDQIQSLPLGLESREHLRLHQAHLSARAADLRPKSVARWDQKAKHLTTPAFSPVVFEIHTTGDTR